MKKMIYPVLATLSFILFSCSMNNNEKSSGIYILDWYAEAVYVMDTTLSASTDPLLLTGDGPSDIAVDDNAIFISNSGYGGDATVQKFSLSGDLLVEKKTGEMTSPGYIEIDDEYIYTSLWLDNSVAVMEKESLNTVKTISGLSAPQEIVKHGDCLYIGSNNISAAGSIYEVKIDGFEISSIEVGSNPSFLDISEDGVIFVSCCGDYNSIYGSIVRISDNQVTHKTDFNSFLGKIKCIDEFVIVLDAMNTAYVLSKEDLSVIDTIDISSLSDVELMNDKVIFSTNVGKMYVADKSSLTDVTEVLPEYGFKTSEMYVK